MTLRETQKDAFSPMRYLNVLEAKVAGKSMNNKKHTKNRD